MSEPVVLHVIRPYASTEEYLEHEAWTLDLRSMVLVDQAPLPRDTTITFDVTLEDGSRPIRAEARVLGMLEPAGGRPGGLRVRFKRYGASTKALIERATALLAAASEGSETPTSLVPRPAEQAGAASAVSVPNTSAVPFTTMASTVPPASTPPHRDALLDALRARSVTIEPLEAAARDVLLERLRQRGQGEDVTTRVQRA